VVFYLSKPLEVQDDQRTKFVTVDLKGSMKTSKLSFIMSCMQLLVAWLCWKYLNHPFS